MSSEVASPSTKLASGKASIWGWIFYEGGIGPYFVLVNIFVFSPYFTSSVVGDPVAGQAIWGYIQAGAGAAIALLSPFLGSLADAAGPRKPGIAFFTITAMIGACSLWFVHPEFSHPIILTCFGVLVAGVSLEFASVYHNSMLTTVARPDNIGKISGVGYAASYLANFSILVVWLGFLGLPALNPDLFGGLAFGLDPDLFEHNRIAGPLAAIMIIILCPFLFFFTVDQKPTGLSAVAAMKAGTAQLIQTVKALPRYRNIARYLVARMIYYDGLQAVFIFAGVYAVGIFNWETAPIVVYALSVMFFAFFSSLIGGYFDDRFGSKRTVFWSVFLFAIGVVGIVSISSDTILFFITFTPEEAQLAAGPVNDILRLAGYETIPQLAFLIIGTFTGTFSGPALSSSRTLLARIAPLDKQGEFFGLYALIGKATSFIAPLVVAISTQVFDSQRIGFASILLFYVVGLSILIAVREERAT